MYDIHHFYTLSYDQVYPSYLGDGKKPVLPAGSFVTCGSDDTIRIWNMDTGMPANTLYRLAIVPYSSRCEDVILEKTCMERYKRNGMRKAFGYRNANTNFSEEG